MRAEWRYLSGNAFMHPLMHLYFQARQHFMKYHQIRNYDHVSVCHWALRCARHLMWGDFVLKQSNVNPDAFESRDIKPTPRLPISWAVGLETMRESEMTGERATVLFLHKVFRRLSVMAFSSFHSDTELPHMTFRCNIWTSRSPTLSALVKFSFYLNGC